MNERKFSLIAAVLIGLFAGGLPLHRAEAAQVSSRPDLEYFKAVNQKAPPQDPQLLFLLMGQYANANLQAEGIEFLSARLKEFEPNLKDAQKALYLSAIGLLRAQHAPGIPLFQRIGWVKETIAMLDRAQTLSGGKIFVVNWISGVVRAQLPDRFNQRTQAEEQLKWCLENAEKAPHAAWLREVYFGMAKLARARNDQARAQDYLRLSGYTNFDRPIVLTTPFSEELATGHAFCPKRISEPVPGRVYVLSGFEFTEYYFIVSEDGHELIAIDAGTRPDSAKAAYEALRAHAPNLPELTTVFVTHSHWDHVGGQRYFRSLNPGLRVYARTNYPEELSRQLNAPGVFGSRFFGERFKVEDMRSFKPDVGVDHPMEVKIGGTQFGLIPVEGGETRDAMFIEMPDQGILFVGDFVMPYLGAPFVEEGNLQGLLDAIDIIVEKNPRYLLHGHEPLTRAFVSPAMLAQLKKHLGWLREQVLEAIRRGDENAAIQQANLIPPDLVTGRPDVYLPYLLIREHAIDRLYDQNVGYWRANLEGISHLSRGDHAEILVDYLGVSARQLEQALQRLVADGKYEMAASLLESSGDRFARNESVSKSRRLIYLKLMEQYQNTDPFKFILYSAKAGEQTPQMPRK